ncbi:hypothetical protein BSKO_01622 [Bryopsis sp. KO-2023]|nr:hypothetical protein BSKO_01622 [Bryopsis sp. KO-2023]
MLVTTDGRHYASMEGDSRSCTGRDPTATNMFSDVPSPPCVFAIAVGDSVSREIGPIAKGWLELQSILDCKIFLPKQSATSVQVGPVYKAVDRICRNASLIHGEGPGVAVPGDFW